MPVCNKIQINKECCLYIWKITEGIDELIQLTHLSDNDSNKLEKFGSESRKKEFLATRILLQQNLAPEAEIINDEHGKPYIKDSDLRISISHTKGYAAILLGTNHELALDLEYLSDRVNRIAPRFLSVTELSQISPENKIIHLYQHWCAKECLIKLYGKKDVHLIRELIISPFSPSDDYFHGQVCRANFSSNYTFKHLQFDNHLLVYAVKRFDR